MTKYKVIDVASGDYWYLDSEQEAKEYALELTKEKPSCTLEVREATEKELKEYEADIAADEKKFSNVSPIKRPSSLD